jgi:histidinol-phosphate aminotransferase
MPHRVPFTPIVAGLPATIPFVGPEAIERRRGAHFKVRVGANESAFGVSPRAAEAMREAIAQVSWYGDPESFELCTEIAARHGVGIDNVCVAGGIDELLGLTVRMLIEPGMPVVTSLGAYPTFNYQVAGFGGDLQAVPYRDDHIDLEAVLGRVRASGAPLVYFANPDNPMGTWHDAGPVAEFIAALPEDCVLVLDEAYGQFAPESVKLDEDVDDPRVIRMHTFSKAHGMAGARIGYAIAHSETIEGFNKIRNHFAVNRVAQVGALASLRDPDFVRSVVTRVADGREDYTRLASDMGLHALESATNFVAIDAGGDGERARRLLRLLEERGVFVRMPGVAPLDRCIRVTIGTTGERAVFAERFRDAWTALD